jgi:hypothetical protein
MVAELSRLVGLLNPKSGDRFAFLGDYVDKGPESLKVVDLVRDLVQRFPDSVAICGNHEEGSMRLYAKAQKQGHWDGLRKAVKEPWLKEMSEDQYEWLRSLPLVARPLPGLIMVHGGMFPAYFEKHHEVGHVPDAWHRGGGKRMDRMRRFLRIRHVYRDGVEKNGKSIAGNMVNLGDEGENTIFWADWYDGREGYAFYGHQPLKSGLPVLHPHAMGLDTGAVFGGRLTAAVVDTGDLSVRPVTMLSPGGGVGPYRVRFVSVEASKAYADWREDFEA